MQALAHISAGDGTWAALPSTAPNSVQNISAAGGSQGNATALTGTNTINEITTVGSGQGVILPTAVSGGYISIINRGANGLLVYPATSGTINKQSANAPYTIPANSSMAFSGSNTTNWYSYDSYQNGDVNTTDASSALTIANNAVSNSKFRQSAGLSVVGNTGSTTANVSDITGTANQTLIVNNAGTGLTFGALNLSSSAAVTGVLVGANGGTGVHKYW